MPVSLEKDNSGLDSTFEATKNGEITGKSLMNFEAQRTLGAPLFGRQNDVLGALVLLGAEKPFPQSRIPALGEQLCVAANTVSIQCGHLDHEHHFF